MRTTTFPGTDGADRALRAIFAGQPVRDMVAGIVRDAAFAPYRTDPDGRAGHIAREALAAFLVDLDVAAAIEVIRSHHDHAFAVSSAVEGLRSSGLLDPVVATASAMLRDRVPAIDDPSAQRMSMAACLAHLSRDLESLDPGDPLDLLDGEEVIVGYLPGGGTSLNPPSAGLTTHAGDYSDCTTIRPDRNLAGFLELVNVTAAEYVDMARRLRGADLTAADPEWAQLWIEVDPSRGHLLDEAQLLDAIDGAPFGFNPMIAFRVEARRLIERDWGRPLAVTGGMLGLHNFDNGSGDPRRFEDSIVISPGPGDLVVAEDRRYDFSEVHGLSPDAFESRVSDGPDAPPATSPSP